MYLTDYIFEKMNECVLISFFYVTENLTTKLISGV